MPVESTYYSANSIAGCKGPDSNSPRWEEPYRYIERHEFPDYPRITGGNYNQNRTQALHGLFDGLVGLN